jgi:hypothetical protein
MYTDYKLKIEHDSKDVERWKDKDGDVFYSHYKVNFSKPCIRDFILPNLIELERGFFPLPPKETGYTDAETKTYRVKTTAYYEFCVGIAAEVNFRISTVPQGRILRERYTFNVLDKELAKIYGVLDVGEFIACRLAYISGNDRKKTDFKTWARTSWRRWGQYRSGC